MANMVAARSAAGFEFFAQGHQKSLGTATLATKHTPTKKPALISQVRAVKSKGNLKYLKN
jgi:hypothetical protein